MSLFRLVKETKSLNCQALLPLSLHVVRSLDCPRLIVNTVPGQCKSTDNSGTNNICHLHVEIPENKSQQRD